MKDKIILITGANRGIGHNILKKIATCGYTVIGTSRSKDGANTIAETLKNSKSSNITRNPTSKKYNQKNSTEFNSKKSSLTRICKNTVPKSPIKRPFDDKFADTQSSAKSSLKNSRKKQFNRTLSSAKNSSKASSQKKRNSISKDKKENIPSQIFQNPHIKMSMNTNQKEENRSSKSKKNFKTISDNYT